MGLLLVVLTLCAHWNKFRQFIYIWWAYIWEEGLIFGMLIGLHIWGRHIFGGGGAELIYREQHITRILWYWNFQNEANEFARN